jgi:hypothetical protein
MYLAIKFWTAKHMLTGYCSCKLSVVFWTNGVLPPALHVDVPCRLPRAPPKERVKKDPPSVPPANVSECKEDRRKADSRPVRHDSRTVVMI